MSLLGLLPTLAELEKPSGAVLVDLIPWATINERGHTIRELGTSDEDRRLAHMIRNWTFLASFRGAYIEFFRQQLWDHLNANKGWLVQLLGLSAACPRDHVEQIATGLQAAIHGDPIIALHILPVQLEGMIRHVLEQRGLQVFRLENDMTQQARTLNSVLAQPEVIAVFGEAMTWTLRFALSEKGAWNLRNEVSHALMSDAAFAQGMTNYLMWITVRLLADHLPRTADGGEAQPV